jgi:ATP/maltotriose-dependent transcriptional regulator MalT
MSAPRAIALCQCFNGALEFQAGRWAEAEAALRESISLYREIGAASGEALACQRLGLLQTAAGQLAAGLATLEEGVLAAEHALMRAHCLARLYATMTRNRLAANDLAAADRALDLGLLMSARHGHCATCDALLLPAAVSVREAQGDLAAAETFCRQLAEAASQHTSRTWLAMSSQTQAELAAARGEIETALTRYVEAYEGFRQANYDYEAARCLAAVAQLRLAHGAPGDVELAQAAQFEASQILARLGAG